MPRDPNGVMTLPASTWVQTGDTVLPVQHNPPFLEIEDALTNSIARDGRTVWTGDMQAGGNKITGLVPGNADDDSVTVEQVGARFSFKTVADLLNDTRLGYSSAEIVVGEGDIITAQGFRYEVAASDATEFDEETAGGVRLSLQAYSGELKDQEANVFGIIRRVEESFEVTVGSGGDYDEYDEAIYDLARRRPTYKMDLSSPLEVSVRLLTGYTPARQLFVNSMNLSWITIISDDAEVPVARSILTLSDPTPDSTVYPFMAANFGAWLPKIGTIFTFDATGDNTNRRGLRAAYGGGVIVLSGYGIKGTVERQCELQHKAQGIMRGALFQGSVDGIGVRCGNGSFAHLGGGATVTGHSVGAAIGANCNLDGTGSNFSSNNTGVRVQNGSFAALMDAVLDDCTTYGLQASPGGRAEILRASIQRCGIAVYGGTGAIIDGSNANLDDAVTNAVLLETGSTFNSWAGNAASALRAERAGGVAVVVSGGSEFNAPSCVLDGAGGVGASFTDGARGNINGASIQNCGSSAVEAVRGAGLVNAFGVNGTGSTNASGHTFRVQHGSEINARTAIGTLSQAANLVNGNGVIYG